MDWKDEFVTKAHNLIFRKYDSKLVAVSSDPPVSPYWFLQTDINYDMEFHEANNGVPFCHRLCYSSSGGKGECETVREAFGEFLEKHSGLKIEWVDEYDFKLGDITFEHDYKTGEMSLTPVTETKHNDKHPVYNVSNIMGGGQKVPSSDNEPEWSAGNLQWETFIEKWKDDEEVKMILEAIIRGDTDYLYQMEENFIDSGTREEKEKYLKTCYNKDGSPTMGFKYVWKIWGTKVANKSLFYKILRKYDFPNLPDNKPIEDPRTLEEIQTELARVRAEIKETSKEARRHWVNNRIGENDRSVKLPDDLKEKQDDLHGELNALFEQEQIKLRKL